MQNILGIVNSSGNIVVKYYNTAYGMNTGITGSLASTIGKYNHMRYKGYYFDEETSFFYCMSRYYVPEWCRFLNADHISFADQSSPVGMNLFAYCANNPVMFSDNSGNWPKWSTIAKIAAGVAIIAGAVALSVVTCGTASVIFAGAAIGAAAGGIGAGISTAVSGGTIDDFADSFVMGTATGAISGAIAASPLGRAGQTVINAALSATNYVGTQHLSGNNATLGGAVVSGISGAACGWIGGNGWLHKSNFLNGMPKLGKNVVNNLKKIIDTEDLIRLTAPPLASSIVGGTYARASSYFNPEGIPLGF